MTEIGVLGPLVTHGASVRLRFTDGSPGEPDATDLAAIVCEALDDLPIAGESTGQAVVPVEFVIERSEAGTWAVRSEGRTGYRGPEADLALYDTLIAVHQTAARHAVESGHLVLHGGAVEYGGGVTALVGASGAGKSTLTAALSLGGAGFVADEVVAVEEASFRVLPFHRPIGLRPGGAAALGVAIPDGPYRFTYPYRIGKVARLSSGGGLERVLLVERDDELGGDVGTVEMLRPAAALVHLANQTLEGEGLERSVFRRLERLVRHVPVGVLRYATLDGARSALAELGLPTAPGRDA